MKTVIKELPPKSLQRRVLIATVASSYTPEHLKYDFVLGDQTIIASQKRFKCLKHGRVLETDRHYLASYKKFAVERAVRFVLNKSNIQ